MRLSATDLDCVRGGREVFRGIGFSLRDGQALAVTGPNGSGKSSLLRMIAGLVRPAAGRIALEGGDPHGTLAEQAHYVGHQDALKAALTARENLAFWSRYLGSGTTAPDAALDTMGLSGLADLPAGILSAGQKRRLALARLVAIPRPVWLLDEPATALDTASQAVLVGLMRRHLDAGGLVVAAVHGALGIEADALQLRQARGGDAA